MINFDSLFSSGRTEKPQQPSVDEKIKAILDAEIHSRRQEFRMIGSAGKHVFAYDVGGGVCVRLYHSDGFVSANKDYQRYSELSLAGFSVPSLRSNLFNSRGKYDFATNLIIGESIGEYLAFANEVCRQSDYVQIVAFLRQALHTKWWPREFNMAGNTLREASSGKIFFIDVGDWLKMTDMSTLKALKRESEIKKMIEIFDQLAK